MAVKLDPLVKSEFRRVWALISEVDSIRSMSKDIRVPAANLEECSSRNIEAGVLA